MSSIKLGSKRAGSAKEKNILHEQGVSLECTGWGGKIGGARPTFDTGDQS